MPGLRINPTTLTVVPDGMGNIMGTSGSSKIVTWLQSGKRPLLLTHIRPDGDAYGALIGLLGALRDYGIPACGYLSSPLPARYRQLFAIPPGLYDGTPLPADASFDAVLCLDAATAERVALPPGREHLLTEMPVANIDHHPDNPGYGDCSWVDATCAATSQMVVTLLDAAGIPLSPDAATPLMTGLLTDCGGFRFNNTDPAALRCAADLIDHGIDYPRIVDALFFSEAYERLRFKGQLLESAHFACDRRLLFAVVNPAMLEAAGIELADTENLVDALRTVTGVDICCLIQQEAEATRFSLRARSPAFPVAGIARALGGGGHALAAGARHPKISDEEAGLRLIEQAGKVLEA